MNIIAGVGNTSEEDYRQCYSKEVNEHEVLSGAEIGMEKKVPGKAYHKGVSLIEIMRMFPDNETAEAWFVEKRWPDGPH